MSAMLPVVRRSLPYTGWIVSGTSVLFSVACLCVGTSHSFFPVWTAFPAALGIGMAVGMAWTLAAAVIHTRAGARPMVSDSLSSAAVMRKIPISTTLSMTILLAGSIGVVELLQLAELLSLVQAAAGMGGLVVAVCEVLWKGLGTDLIISAGLVFAAQLVWVAVRERLTLRRRD